MVPDGDFNLVGKNWPDQRARKLRNVDFLVLRHQRIAGQWVVMLPTGECTDTADRRIHHLQACAITLSPYHPLMECWCDFAALQFNFAGRVKCDLGIVKGAMVALINPQHYYKFMLAGCTCNGVSYGT